MGVGAESVAQAFAGHHGRSDEETMNGQAVDVEDFVGRAQQVDVINHSQQNRFF